MLSYVCMSTVAPSADEVPQYATMEKTLKPEDDGVCWEHRYVCGLLSRTRVPSAV